MAPEPFNVTKERDKLYDAMAKAYQKHGTVRHPEWEAAEQKLYEFNKIHGSEYNPD